VRLADECEGFNNLIFHAVAEHDHRSGVPCVVDLYRLGGAEEVLELGWEEALEGIVLVEWPERLGALAPPGALRIALTPLDEDGREALLCCARCASQRGELSPEGSEGFVLSRHHRGIEPVERLRGVDAEVL
jgi:hypothetical protein